MEKHVPYKILFALLIIAFQPVYGQLELHYSFENYSNKEGLDQNTIWAIEQDKYGMFWLGTANGLIKYDGYTFVDVSRNLEYQGDIYDERIWDILTDADGLIWFLSRNDGLNIYHHTLDRFIKTSPDSQANLTGLKEDESGSIWVFGDGYLASVSKSIEDDTIITRWTPNLFPEELAKLRINDLLKVNEEQYLLATAGGIYKMNLSGNTLEATFELDTLLPEISISSFLRHNDILWIGTASGLFKTVLDGRKIRHLNTFIRDRSDPASIGGNDIRDLLLGPDDCLWIGTWGGGLSMYDNDNEIFTNFHFDPRRQDALSSQQINCIYMDQFNVIWIGTAQGGLSKLDLEQKQFTNIEHNPYNNNTIPGNLVNSILEDREGYLWISTYEDPLSKSMEPVSIQTINKLSFRRFTSWYNTHTCKNILDIYEDVHGYIWLGYENSVVVYNRQSDSFTEIKFMEEGESQPAPIHNVNFIGAVDARRIMVAGNRIVILEDPWEYLESAQRSKITIHAAVVTDVYEESNVITAEIEDPDKIWVGFRNLGLHLYSLEGNSLVLKKDYLLDETEDSSLSNNTVFSILRDSDYQLWIGTFGGGLNRMLNDPALTEGKFDHFDTLDLQQDAIYGIIEENDSLMWLSTDMGICKLNRRSQEIFRYNMADGIASNNFRKNAYYKGPSGFCYFGGLFGVSLFKPEQIQPNLISPEIKLNGLRINNRSLKTGERINKKYLLEKPINELTELVLTRTDRHIALDVIVMHTSTPEKNSFSYILDGFDKEWMEMNEGSSTLNYTNLPSGKYTLIIKGFNGDGIQSESEYKLQLSMLAPWYAQWWSKIIYGLFGLSIIIAVSIYIIKLNSLRNKLHFEKIDKDRITDINKAKLRFFTNISHEFRTPLALISIPLQKLQELVTDPEQKKYLAAADKNTGKLIRLIDQLLAFRKIEHGKMELSLSSTSMDEFLFPIAEAFDALSVKKEIEFYYLVKDPDFSFVIDLEKTEQVLYNLLSNAFKFTAPGGKVSLKGKSCEIDRKKFICFEVKDSGKGIAKKDLELIFDRFYQSDSELKNLGTGIGLSYSKSIVELQQGFIQVNSTPGKGTTFSVLIPVSDKSPTESAKSEVQRMNPLELFDFEELAAGSKAVKKEMDNQGSSILIVDDEEEFRIAIRDIFKNTFKIREASNGKEGLKIAQNDHPDLIISDVMMPVMNGYDFCNKIKSDIELCHIPFILLTALEEMPYHIQGVEYGADSYITKPFNLKYLEVSVIKLIENRTKIQEHFSKNHSLPKGVELSGIDTVFIEKVNAAIRQNLDNSSFGVEDLAESVNLSSSHFYRKLKSLIGQNPNAYIRNFRLHTAADILSGNPGINVKTVMFEVGFESASHFSHAFKKKFGLSPSEFCE